MSKKSFLKDLRVKEPCTEDWGEMSGNERVRFCSHCSLNVNNISEMTRGEALRLVKKSKGRLCVRYVQHPKTKAPVFANKLYQITRRTGVAAGVLGATLAASSMTYAQGNVFEPQKITKLPINLKQNVNAEESNTRKSSVGTGEISGVVTDQTGVVIPGATITVTFESLRRSTTSNDYGNYSIRNLPEGKFELIVSAPGFLERKVPQVEISKSAEVQTINAQMEVAMIISGAIAVRETIENPLVSAAYNEKNREVQSLISRGADVNAKDREYYSRTALHVAVSDGNLKIVKMLLNAGADVNALDEEGNTPLMMLDEETPTQIIELLIKYGTKLNIQSKEDKNTALINAAMQDNFKAMKILIEAGADVNLRDKDGDSAFDLVDDEKIEQLLIAYGAERDD